MSPRDDHVAEIDADAELDAPLVGQLRLAVDHPALDLGGATHRVNDACELRQQAVAGVLDDVPPVLLDFRIDQLPEMRLEAFVRALLVGTHQPGISRHIESEDRGEAAGRGRCTEERTRKPLLRAGVDRRGRDG
jgi:hypothetical protein